MKLVDSSSFANFRKRGNVLAALQSAASHGMRHISALSDAPPTQRLLAAISSLLAPGSMRLSSCVDRKRPPTAIFASNDDMAAAVVSVAHRKGLDVPRDLSVVGFDDTMTATTVWPELTTIRQPIAAMADAALNLLLRKIRHKKGARRRSLWIICLRMS